MKRKGSKIPHRSLSDVPVHLTFRLYGSLPRAMLSILRERLDKTLARIDRQFAGEDHFAAATERTQLRLMAFTDYELALDRALAEDSNGPYHLHHHPAVGRLVLDAWVRAHERGVFHLFAGCVMPNHVHFVIRQRAGAEEVSLGPIMKSQKGFTARRANALLGLAGQPFWAEGYFDRDVRPGGFHPVVRYVLENPVKAGLVRDWRDWELSWLHPELEGVF